MQKDVEGNFLKVVTDPEILKLFPNGAPGNVVQCGTCGTYLRTGQPHCATEPTPHVSFEMLTVREAPPFDAAERRADEHKTRLAKKGEKWCS